MLIIPTPLRDVSRVVAAEGIDLLVRRLLNIAPAEMPPVRTSVPPLSSLSVTVIV